MYDREFKRDAYIALGVQEVWLVDRWARVAEVSRMRGPGNIVEDVLHWRVPPLERPVEISLTDIFSGL